MGKRSQQHDVVDLGSVAASGERGLLSFTDATLDVSHIIEEMPKNEALFFFMASNTMHRL